MQIRSKRLPAVETLLGLSNPGMQRSFLRFGRWHLAECLLQNEGEGSLSQLRRLSPEIERGLVQAAAANLPGAGVQAQLACVALYVGNNVRSFYPARGLTAKIQGSGRNAGNIKNDVDARDLARSAGFSKTARVVHYGSVEDGTFLAVRIHLRPQTAQVRRQDPAGSSDP